MPLIDWEVKEHKRFSCLWLCKMHAVWQYVSEHQETCLGKDKVCSTLKGQSEFLTLTSNCRFSRSIQARAFREFRTDPIDSIGSYIPDYVSKIRLSLRSRSFRVGIEVGVKVIVQG